jgi:uncharacterized tellurite resistance protein B-like protein
MNYSLVLTKLYFILIYADGKVNEHELATGKQIVKAESLQEEEFRVQMEVLKSKQPNAILTECIQGLKKLDRKKQIRIVAWLCVVANGDGYMDKAEWQLIYRLYHKELALPLEEIFLVQKELGRLPRENSDLLKSVA